MGTMKRKRGHFILWTPCFLHSVHVFPVPRPCLNWPLERISYDPALLAELFCTCCGYSLSTHRTAQWGRGKTWKEQIFLGRDGKTIRIKTKQGTEMAN